MVLSSLPQKTSFKVSFEKMQSLNVGGIKASDKKNHQKRFCSFIIKEEFLIVCIIRIIVWFIQLKAVSLSIYTGLGSAGNTARMVQTKSGHDLYFKVTS
jgi:hypothetical protein